MMMMGVGAAMMIKRKLVHAKAGMEPLLAGLANLFARGCRPLWSRLKAPLCQCVFCAFLV